METMEVVIVSNSKRELLTFQDETAKLIYVYIPLTSEELATLCLSDAPGLNYAFRIGVIKKSDRFDNH